MNKEKLEKELKNNKIKLYKLEKHIDPNTAKDLRADYISSKADSPLNSIKKINFSPKIVLNRNIENLVGSVEIPLGIAGPLKINGEHANGSFYIPLATTEGALVASTNRGATCINKCGGINTFAFNSGITRAPLFRVKSINHGQALIKWIETNFKTLQDAAKKAENHLNLTDFTPYTLGKTVWIRFVFDTDQAMGMNKATKASEVVSKIIVHKCKATLSTISGNLCIDKKASYLNKILGRSWKVQAELVLKNSVIKNILNTTPEKLVEINKYKVWEGSHMAGSISNNSQIANIIAAIFIATGQDAAHILDSSMGDVVFEKSGNDVYTSINIASLTIGTKGGGTHLPKQQEALKLMLSNVSENVNKKQKKIHPTHKFAEIIIAAVLAGEISLHGALAADELVKAHQRLGKGNNGY